jgi:hypothetical protein
MLVDFSPLLGETGSALDQTYLSLHERSIYHTIPMMGGVRKQQWLQSYNVIGKSHRSPSLRKTNICTATNIAASSETILNLAYLYHAAKLSKNVAAEFPDLDYLTQRQSIAHLFLGSLPTTRQQLAIRHLAARGISPASIARGRKSGNVKQKVAASRRDFKSLSDYVRATTDLAGRTLQPSNAITNPGMRLERLVEVYLARRQSRPGPRRNLTWLQKLHIGILALAEDEGYMNFDVVRLVLRGQDLLCEIRAMCKRDAPSIYRQDLFTEDTELGDFLGAMFAMPWENTRLGERRVIC